MNDTLPGLQPSHLRYQPPMRRYRFMFADGSLVDVEAARDDSELRGWVRVQVFGAGKGEKEGPNIVGVAELSESGAKVSGDG